MAKGRRLFSARFVYVCHLLYGIPTAVLVGRGLLTSLIQPTLRAGLSPGLGQSSGGFGELGLENVEDGDPSSLGTRPRAAPSFWGSFPNALPEPAGLQSLPVTSCYTVLTSREDWPHPPCTCLPKNHGLLLNPPEPLSFH